MHVTHLKVTNLRCIAETTLSLNVPGQAGLTLPNVNVLLGANGSGKTSVLRALALSVLGPLLSSSSGFVPEGLIRRPPGRRSAASVARLPPATMEARVTLQGTELPPYARVLDGEELTMTTTVGALGTAERLLCQVLPPNVSGLVEKLQYDDAAHAFFVVGYGATRRVESSTGVDESARTKSRRRRYARVASLFEDHLGLMPLSYWLPDYAKRNRGRYTQVLALVNRLLPADCRMRSTVSETPTGREHLFEMNGITLPFRALSDGYRAYIGWIGDMLFHLCMGAASGAKLVETRGLVLLDEIDLHLHPEWQRVVLPTLSRTLPNVQFVVSTHSPLVVGSLEAENLFSLVEEGGATVVKRLPEPVRGRSAEQILLSPYFGLESTRAQPVADKLQALAQAAAQGDAKASMQYLRLLSGGLRREEIDAIEVETSLEDVATPEPAKPALARKARSTMKVVARRRR